MKTAIQSLQTTATEVNIYYGSLTQPLQRCRIIPSIGNNENDYARIER
jgi:hypothetical protein